MRIESIGYVNKLIKKRTEFLQEKLGGPLPNFEEYQRLDITVRIFNEKFWNERSISTHGIKITPGEAQRLFAMVKTYNDDELFRVENELRDLGVELESKNSCDNETNN